MTRDEVLSMALEAGWREVFTPPVALYRFAKLITDRMIQNGYRKCAEGQGVTQFCSQLESAVAGVRARDEALLRQALEALVWEVGSEPALYAPQIRATIAALRERLGEKE